MKGSLRVGVALLTGALMAVSVVGAQGAGVGLDVVPAKLDLATSLGRTYSIPVSVRNDNDTSTHVQVSEADFTVNETGDYAFTKPGTNAYSVLKYIAVNPREFDLPANSFQQVQLTLTMPSGVPMSGEYSGIVFFQTRPERRRGAVAFSARVATKIYSTIPGTVKYAGEIAKMSVASGPTGELYRVLFKNSGNAHVYLNGRLEIRRGGATVSKLTIPPSLLVERGCERLIEIPGPRVSAGQYDVVAIVDYGGPTLTGGQIQFDAK